MPSRLFSDIRFAEGMGAIHEVIYPTDALGQ
jgi:hypothetical protein